VPQRFSSRTSSVSRLTAIPVFVKQSCTHSSFGTSLPGEPVSLIRVISAPEALPGVLHRLFGLSLQPEVLPGVLRHSRGYPQVAACRGSAGDLSHSPAWRGPLVTWMSPTTPSPTALHATIAFAFCASNQLLSSCHHLTSHTCRDASRRLTELDARLHTSASYSMTLASSCQLKSTAIRVFSSRLCLHLFPDANTC
jgi:hypothetical protein